MADAVASEQKIYGSSECDSTRISGTYAGLLATTEIGIGSLLHAFHIPFTDYILSLNQILILLKAAKDCANYGIYFQHRFYFKISVSHRKKAYPMLALACKELCFT